MNKIHQFHYTNQSKSTLIKEPDLKEQIKQFRNSAYFPLRLIHYILKPFWSIRRFFTDAHFRAALITGLKFNKGYHQRSAFTKMDRYPVVFAACARYLNNYAQPKILSFGCSTGEEVASIGDYIPTAVVSGVDINEWCITQCKKKYAGGNFSFYHRNAAEFTNAGDFDAIFCMAVFQHTENRLGKDNATARGFTFEQFEAELMMLDKKLKPGGLLVIDNTDFNFES